MIYINLFSFTGELPLSIIIFDATLVICLALLITLLYIKYNQSKFKSYLSNLMSLIPFRQKEQSSSNGFNNALELDKKLINHEKNILYSSIYRELTHMMEVDKLYHDPRLTRDGVVERIGTSKKVFLEALQNNVNMNFIDYVNTFRLNEAIALLENGDYTNETIAEIVGFGSANTFYRQFKLKYGLSPFEYKKNLNMLLIDNEQYKI